MTNRHDPHREEWIKRRKIEQAQGWLSAYRRNGLDPFASLNRPHPFRPVFFKTDAQYHLAICYYYGVEVAQNYVEAAKLYRQAAEQNSTSSQYQLSQCYAKGEGVPQDLVEATAWLFVFIHGLEHSNDIGTQGGLTPFEMSGVQSRIAESKRMLDDFCNQLTDWQMQATQNRIGVILAKLEDTWKRYWASPEGVERRAELNRPRGDGTLRR